MTEATFNVSESAARRIREILARKPDVRMLRVSVEGGGCSGFQYRFDLVAGGESDDMVIERDGATILVDQVSLPFLAGSVLDYVDDLIGSSFQVRNPNAKAACGCGTSFTV